MRKKLIIFPLLLIAIVALVLLQRGIVPISMSNTIESPKTVIKTMEFEVRKNEGLLTNEIIVNSGTVDYRLIRPDGSIEVNKLLSTTSDNLFTVDTSYINGDWIVELHFNDATASYNISFNK